MKNKTVIFLLSFFSGCMLGPNYHPPEIAVTNTWNEENAEINKTWWEVFEDPLLTEYIQEAEKCNYDILTAEANILRAKALRQIVASNLFPQIGTNWSAQKTYFSKNGPVFSLPGNTAQDTAGLPFALQIPQVQNLFNALFDASWELDIFGKTRRAVESARAYFESEIEQKNVMLLSVFAEVSRNYMQLRSLQEKQRLLERKVAIYEEKKKLIYDRYLVGIANKIDFEESDKILEETKAELPEITSEIYKSIYTLSILTGKMPDALLEELIAYKALPKVPLTITTGLQSDLLRRRPDVRKAERDLAAATAAIGVAVASFFPSVDLMGLVGFQSLQLPELLNWGSRTFSYGTNMTMPLYQGGRLWGQLHLTQAEQTSTAYTYQQTVLNALEDAESSLVAYCESLKASQHQKRALEQEEAILEISFQRYFYGLIDRLSLLDTESTLIDSQISNLQRDTDSLFNAIALYKALGGGWEREYPCK